MATVRILLAFICFAAVGKLHVPDRNLLIPSSVPPVVLIARKELGVREATGKNDGPRIKAYLAAAGLKTGAPWCAAFVSWVHQQAGDPLPRTGWSPALFPQAKLKKMPAPGLVFGIYFPELKRIAHCGFVEALHGKWIYTIEGNTNPAGTREGDGVHRRLRLQKTIRSYADWRYTCEK